MSDTAKHYSGSLFRVDLDQEIAALPWRSVKSVIGILEHLESVARCQEKEFCAATKKAPSGKANSKPAKERMFEQRQSEGTRYRELGRQVIRTAMCQVRVLRARTQEMQSLVLINPWTVAERMWLDLVMGCKTPLFELNFLEELWGISSDRLQVDGWTLSRHWHQFVLIHAEIEIVLARRQSLVELSDTVEGQLGNWLKRFAEILEKLDEESAA
jgi:hypothetical protein